MAHTKDTHDTKLANPGCQNGGRGVLTLLIGFAILGFGVTAVAAPPPLPFIPFKRIDVDPKKTYEITPENGPWMVFAASFMGEGAEDQAHELVMELRQRHRLPAYIHRKRFDYTEPVPGLGVNRYGEIKQMRHASAKAFDEGGGVRHRELAGVVPELRQPLDEVCTGAFIVPVLDRGSVEQLAAYGFQLSFHVRVVGEVHLLELVDEPHQPVQRLLVYPGFGRADGMQHVVAQLGRLIP